MKSKRATGMVALIVTVLIWGSTCVVTKSALDSFGPFGLVFVRFALAYLVLLPFARRQGYQPRLSLQKDVFWYGMTGVVMFFGFQNVGLLFTSAVAGILVQNAVPAVIAFFAWLLLRETLSRQKVLGIVLALLGSMVVAVSTSSSAAGTRPWLGNLLVFAGIVAWGVYTAQGKRLMTKGSPLVLTVGSFGSALLVLLPIAAVETYVLGWPTLDAGSIGAVLYLSLAVSALTMWLWNVAIERIEANVCGLYLNLMPIVGVLLALFMGETISIGQIVGGVIIALGVLIGERARSA